MYTCVMHPEVVSDKPGDCPKCGMHLVPEESEGGFERWFRCDILMYQS